MTKERELRRNAEKFVQDALGATQEKRPTKKDVKRAVDKIVRSYAPVITASPSGVKKSVRFD